MPIDAPYCILHLLHFLFHLHLHIDPPGRYMVEKICTNQPPKRKSASSPTKCIACSLDTYRGALYPIFFIFYFIFAFLSPPEDVSRTMLNQKTRVMIFFFVNLDCGRVPFSAPHLTYVFENINVSMNMICCC